MQDTKSNKELLAYVGGVFDVGGCVKIEPKTSGVSLFAWVTHKNFKLIETLQALGAFIQRHDSQYRARWKDKKAYLFLKSVLPYLRVRKDQATVGIEFWEEKTNTPSEDTNIVYITRLKLLKQDEEKGG
jgi:hypothetical protein